MKYKFRNIILIFLFSLFFANHFFGKDIKFTGLNKLSINDIESLSSYDSKTSDYSEIDANQIVKDLYLSDLIYDITLKNNSDFFLISILEAPILENVYINGNIRIKDEQIFNYITSKSNNFLSNNDIQKDINLIKNLYTSQGFYDVSVTASTEKYSNDRVNLIIDINEGEFSQLTSINFNGNNFYSNRYLSSIINSNTVSSFNFFSKGSNLNYDIFEFDKNSIQNKYLNDGFRDVKISYVLKKNKLFNFDLNFFIEENTRYKIDKIDFKIDENIPKSDDFDSLINEFYKKLIKNNYFYNKDLIFNLVKNLNEILIRDNNFNLIIDADILFENNSYKLVIFSKNVNPKIINKVSISGNSITKDYVIRSKLNSLPGSYLNNFTLEEDKNKLLSTKYINSVDTEVIDNTDGAVDININVVENKKTGSILLAGTASSDVGLGAAFGLKDANIFGTGNELNSSFNINSESAFFDISYKKYSLNNPNIANTYKIYNAESDYTNSFGYKSKSYGIGYSINYKINQDINSNFGISYSSKKGYAAKNTSDRSITESIGTFNDITFSYSLNINKSNDSFYPSQGSINDFYIEYSPNNLSDNEYIKTTVSNSLYFKKETSSNFIFLINKLGLAESLNGNLKTINAFSLGGLSFKGFDYKGIGPTTANGIYLGGNKYLTSTIGYGTKFLFDEKDNINLKFFMTTGSIWDSDYTKSSFNLRTSLGASMDFLTSVGPISFSYSVPVDKDKNDKVQNFNFTIGTSF